MRRLAEGRKVEALNQLNYALYLDANNPVLIAMQRRVYGAVGMKELRVEGKGGKPRFERLETCREVPAAEEIGREIGLLLGEYNEVVKRIA